MTTETDLLPDEIYVRKTTKKGLSAVRPESPLAERKKINQHSKLNRTKYIRADLVSAPSTAAGGGDMNDLRTEVWNGAGLLTEQAEMHLDRILDYLVKKGYLSDGMTAQQHYDCGYHAATEQQKTAEPDAAYALEWTEGVLSALYDWQNDRKSGAPYMDKSDEVRAYEAIRSILRAHLTTKPNQDDLRKVREALIAYRDNAAVKHPQVAQRGEEALSIIDRIIGE